MLLNLQIQFNKKLTSTIYSGKQYCHVAEWRGKGQQNP